MFKNIHKHCYEMMYVVPSEYNGSVREKLLNHSVLSTSNGPTVSSDLVGMTILGRRAKYLWKGLHTFDSTVCKGINLPGIECIPLMKEIWLPKVLTLITDSTICRDGMTFGTVASSGLIWWSGLEITNLPDPVDLCKAAKWPCKCILLLPEVGDISVLL